MIQDGRPPAGRAPEQLGGMRCRGGNRGGAFGASLRARRKIIGTAEINGLVTNIIIGIKGLGSRRLTFSGSVLRKEDGL
jgi:hypothetical protein